MPEMSVWGRPRELAISHHLTATLTQIHISPPSTHRLKWQLLEITLCKENHQEFQGTITIYQWSSSEFCTCTTSINLVFNIFTHPRPWSLPPWWALSSVFWLVTCIHRWQRIKLKGESLQSTWGHIWFVFPCPFCLFSNPSPCFLFPLAEACVPAKDVLAPSPKTAPATICSWFSTAFATSRSWAIVGGKGGRNVWRYWELRSCARLRRMSSGQLVCKISKSKRPVRICSCLISWVCAGWQLWAAQLWMTLTVAMHSWGFKMNSHVTNTAEYCTYL